MTETEPAERRTRPFADTLRDLDKGRVHAEAGERLQELIAAVIEVRKAGTLTITVKVDPTKATEETVQVVGTVVAKIPRATRASLFFVDDEQNLTRDNPRQPALPLAGLPGGADETDAQRRAR